MTKTEYAQYLQSEHWREKRRESIEAAANKCERCDIPRWLAEIAYDQDLHVHHKTYENLGNEDCDDLEVLCRRCHEIETFGRSDLRAPAETKCGVCGRTHWDKRADLCTVCYQLLSDPSYLEDLGATPVRRPTEEGFVPTVQIASNAMLAATSMSPLDIKEFLSALVVDYVVNIYSRPPLSLERIKATCEDFEALLELVDFPSDSGKIPNFLRNIREGSVV